MVRHVAIPVGGPFPDTHRLQMGWLQGRHLPLVDRIVGDAIEADLAIRPGLDAGPFDTLIEVARLPGREMIDMAGRSSGAARVDAHADVAMRYPLLRVDHLPILIFVG